VNSSQVRAPGLLGLLAPSLPQPQQADPQLLEMIFREGRYIADQIGMFPGGVRDKKYPSDDLDPFGSHAAAPLESIYRPNAARIFYALLINVRSVLGMVVKVADLLRKTANDKRGVGQISRGLSSLSFSQKITIEQGRVEIEDDSTWRMFRNALNGVEVDRLRPCPEPKCRRIYYATRQNKMACDKHLALAAVKRSQANKKAKAAEYELNRKAARLAKKKGIGAGEALAKVRSRSKSSP
jgi:hypothetical protein